MCHGILSSFRTYIIYQAGRTKRWVRRIRTNVIFEKLERYFYIRLPFFRHDYVISKRFLKNIPSCNLYDRMVNNNTTRWNENGRFRRMALFAIQKDDDNDWTGRRNNYRTGNNWTPFAVIGRFRESEENRRSTKTPTLPGNCHPLKQTKKPPAVVGWNFVMEVRPGGAHVPYWIELTSRRGRIIEI